MIAYSWQILAYCSCIRFFRVQYSTMHIRQLQEFFDYKPDFSEDPQHIVDGIIATAKTYLPAADVATIQKTYEFAKAAHERGKRHS